MNTPGLGYFVNGASRFPKPLTPNPGLISGDQPWHERIKNSTNYVFLNKAVFVLCQIPEPC